MAAFGIAIAGGKILEPLGHEDCPVEKSAAYMSIHMALTGFRGTLAPFIGYWILSQFRVQAVALTGGLLIILAASLLNVCGTIPYSSSALDSQLNSGASWYADRF